MPTSVICLLCASAWAAGFPIAGAYGFDWLKPKTAQCKRITPEAAAKFRTCEFADSGAFGLPLAHHTCRAGKHSEVIVLKSLAQCTEALETMRANAP
ncbi:MAG TPA: hypothetical protein VFO28_08920 [Burkholderiaceae bacterium]|nr:hypothetical protein [Burkholderiaceae bacterium]